MKFRKKPIVIDAEQFFENQKPWPEGVFHVPNPCPPGKHHFVKTLEGTLTVSERDWIITGVKGERYPCKPDIFEATYEPESLSGDSP